METQLLNIDCFEDTANKALENLTFLQFPVAHIPPSSPTSTFLDILILCLDSAFEVSLGIDKLPIDSALSKFFSDVLPQNVDGDLVDFEAHFPYSRRKSFASEEEAEALNGEKEVDCHRPSELETLEIPKKSSGSTADYRYTHQYEIIQFETPELDVLLENASFFGKEELHTLSNIPEIENNLEMLKPGPIMKYSCGVRESILSVEDIALEVPMEQKANMSKDDGSLENQIHFNPTTFPLVEADEIVLGSILDFSVEDKLFSFFENIELQHWTQNDNSDITGMDLLGSREYEITQLLYNVSGQFHDSEFESPENFSEMDLISMVEISHVHLKSENAGTLVCDSFLLDSPIVFQEFQILDVDSSENFEIIFNKQTTDEPGTSGWMFNEDMNFKNFNKLIVSHELALVDEIFKSLPVPLLEHEKLRSSYVTIEEKLAHLKPQPLSALDGIYLDWHLLEEDNLSCKTYFDNENLLEDIDSPRNDFDWNCLSDEKLVYNLVFFEDSVDGLNMEGKMEPKQLFSDASVITNTIMVGDSSKLSDDFPQSDDREQLAKNDADRASLLLKSMSQFNDLDFFMNPQKATSRENSTSVAKACLNSNATSTKVPLSNSFPAVSEGPKSHSRLAMNENINKQKKPFNLLPVPDKSNMRSVDTAKEVEAQSMPLSIPSIFTEESEHIQQSMMSFPERLVLVNTQNLDKEMIFSRRSTYQRILAMEKEGAQVVERDSDLPVDAIISSEICLVWYDCRNIGKKATALDEASSCLPLCIDNIATNVLTLLSFTFSGCIMIFEGEDSFLSTVMEFSDGLYAAAASLGINMQLFCSHSSELTDEIILNCVVNVTELTRGVYPRMSESETLAESFLTKFPSVNPLTAHAILSSGGMLIEFLDWSHERRASAIRKYHVPDESITLFSALCKYGEREDSRSIMTDCSSSVSSGPDSGRINFNAASERKRRKYNCSPDKCEIRTEDLLCFDPSNQFTTDTLDPSLVQKPYDSWISKDPDIFHDSRKPRLPSQNCFIGEEQDLETTLVMKPSIIPKSYDLRMAKGPRILNDKFLGKKEESVMATIDDFDLLNASNSEILHEDQKGEVIDLNGSPTLAEDFTIDNSVKLTSMPEMERGSTRKSKSARRLSFGQNSHPAFQADSEIYSGSDIWNSKKAQRKSSQVGANICSYTDLENDVSPLKHHNKLLEEGFKQRYEEKSKQMQFQEKETSPYGRTPLSHALRLNSPLQNTPWTMEFLNRIREKSRLRQQSLPPDNTAPCFGYSVNTSKDIRRSPSILDFFKYQGGSSSRKLPEHKRQKRPIQSSSSSKNEKSSASILPTWTPVDKRARQKLSFALNDGGNQTKLVWSDETHRLGKKLQRQI
ncbi:hypothetical protein FNV43_RR24095 [Rhamnella rubrinervis]|uniref:Protein SHORTAGE IN CHIASMATA 1 n=1 Tax=Rhamnella rubrinervis TaxID=2594499 RepID=A0A8K0DRR9_9ROSA|nr:hypothetical protein FNV43_RR24095 [Rhamnella rubrinervis]